MCAERLLNFHLNDRQQLQAKAGEGVFGQVIKAVTAADWQVKLRSDLEPASGPGYHLLYNRAVLEPNCLSLRRCYLDHYYRIEATNDRWDWPVAKMPFTARPGSHWFQEYWRDRLFKGHEIRADGHIFMPLQGRLLLHRHFQAMSPIEMIKATLAADPKRKIFATLHPKETYTAEERNALTRLGDRFHLSDRPSMALLAGCDYVVTENSALGIIGYFALKPLVLFAQIDFHHIAGSVPNVGVEAAFKTTQKPQPFARYLHWFFKQQAICDVAEDALDQITRRLQQHGWPI